MTKCKECRRKFPARLISELFVNGEYRRVCPLCALEIIRATHNAPNYVFTGERAKKMYKEAVALVKASGGC